MAGLHDDQGKMTAEGEIEKRVITLNASLCACLLLYRKAGCSDAIFGTVQALSSRISYSISANAASHHEYTLTLTHLHASANMFTENIHLVTSFFSLKNCHTDIFFLLLYNEKVSVSMIWVVYY